MIHPRVAYPLKDQARDATRMETFRWILTPTRATKGKGSSSRSGVKLRRINRRIKWKQKLRTRYFRALSMYSWQHADVSCYSVCSARWNGAKANSKSKHCAIKSYGQEKIVLLRLPAALESGPEPSALLGKCIFRLESSIVSYAITQYGFFSSTASRSCLRPAIV